LLGVSVPFFYFMGRQVDENDEDDLTTGVVEKKPEQ
jgi:hypothetical protein